MERKKIKTLFLLEAVEEEENQSQRDLSSKLNVSLGLVNGFLKRLTLDGYFKVRSVSNNKLKYSLTQKGIDEKASLTTQYIMHLISQYQEAQRRLIQIMGDLTTKDIRKLVLYGIGELTEIACAIVPKIDQEILHIVDNQNAGKAIFGKQILDDDILMKVEYDALLVMDIEKYESIRSMLIEKGIQKEKIISLY